MSTGGSGSAAGTGASGTTAGATGAAGPAVRWCAGRGRCGPAGRAAQSAGGWLHAGRGLRRVAGRGDQHGKDQRAVFAVENARVVGDIRQTAGFDKRHTFGCGK